MRRRAFISLLGGAAAAWPLAGRAQQQGKLPTIGHLGGTTPLAESRWVAAFVQRLHELGWIKGRTVAIESRWTEGRAERAAEIAAEFVRMKVDVIITTGTTNVIVTKQATSAIPLVFAAAGDPVGTGLVASLGDLAATARVCHSWRPLVRASGSSLCARSSRVSADWQSLAMSTTRSSCWRWIRRRQPHVRADSMLSHRKSGKRRISRP